MVIGLGNVDMICVVCELCFMVNNIMVKRIQIFWCSPPTYIPLLVNRYLQLEVPMYLPALLLISSLSKRKGRFLTALVLDLLDAVLLDCNNTVVVSRLLSSVSN